MKIVHVSQPVDAGVAAVVLALAVDQRARGWQVDIVCPPSGWLVDRARECGLRTHPWRAGRQPGVRSVAETASLRALLRRLGPDVVHLHSSKAGLAGRLALRGRTPTIFQPHMWSFQSLRGPLRRLCLGWEKAASRWTHQLVCVSDDELAAGRAAGVSAPAEVVCNGVDTDRLRPADRAAARGRLGLPEDAPLAVCVGRLAQFKGQDQLLTAWPSVLAAVPHARVVIVGDGPMGPVWRAEHPVARDDSVLWWGHGDAAAEFYAAADVVVLPSRAEGMALVPLEAMACGRPVVAFDVGGVRQSVGDAGAVVSPGDTLALAAAVAARLADPELAAAEGSRGRRRAVDLFDQSRVGDQFALLVDKLVGDQPSEPT
ncbi:glycosyltransferase [Actinokineospora iranica]|uniref:Glycosyltransferase involved in cell wall bisynthesis n=1 Tax=Actinokineospora iranica TaxID=1271860 RepID=A0A1G6XD02_9PSEU|nr:glycosyltransferase [Actinokineospora iranica]SDD75951.1 Glycosyltransferase involved in cell wall bisynthesis [Actinokineospora iranica]